MNPDALVIAAAAGFGLLIGSFANVCIHRIPLGQSVVTPRSRCPRCGQPIAGWDNVPVLSWLLLFGKCRRCREPIASRYPLVEAANGALYALIAAVHGIAVRSLFEMLLATALIILALIDLDHRILPNVITLPMIAVGIAAAALAPPPGPLESVLSAAALYGVFAVIASAYKKVRGIEGLGQGDWKMAAMLGAFLGWQGALFAVFAGAVLGSVLGGLFIAFSRRDSQYALPFGTFLSLGGVAALFVGRHFVAWYRGFLQ